VVPLAWAPAPPSPGLHLGERHGAPLRLTTAERPEPRQWRRAAAATAGEGRPREGETGERREERRAGVVAARPEPKQQRGPAAAIYSGC
jgi:hypothetical protein